MKKIVVVDDSETVLSMLEHVLKEWGFEVHAGADGHAAMDIIRNVKPDLLILDHQLPASVGPDLFRRLKQDGVLIPTIFLSGTPYYEIKYGYGLENEDRIRFLEKPIELKRLRSLVDELLPPGAAAS
ncbi:MAG: response regulator [Elusimicrobia bacterium]|nr:response regulator [Elusimicrobiota bacterium]